MSTASIPLKFENILASCHFANLCSADLSNTVFRMVLLDNEHLRIPNSTEWCLHVHSGRAWVSFEGRDYYLECGENMKIPLVKHGAIVSPIRKDALFFELKLLEYSQS